jgi:hypothetical protein
MGDRFSARRPFRGIGPKLSAGGQVGVKPTLDLGGKRCWHFPYLNNCAGECDAEHTDLLCAHDRHLSERIPGKTGTSGRVGPHLSCQVTGTFAPSRQIRLRDRSGAGEEKPERALLAA